MKKTSNKTTPAWLLALALSAAVPAATLAQTGSEAQQAAAATAADTSADQSEQAQTIRKLLAIKQALEDKRERVRELLAQLGGADEADMEKIRQQIAEARDTIAELTRSFENIAVGGASLRSFDTDSQQKLSWHDELMQVARPLLDGLKEATAKPRRIEELRREIELYRQQLEITRKAGEALARFERAEMPPAVAEGVAEVAASWRERGSDLERSLGIAREELRNLESDTVPLMQTLVGIAKEFFLGRGLTLLIALLAGLFVWIVLRALRRLAAARRKAAPNSDQAARMRVLFYAYHLLTILLVSLAVLTVFYARGDLLLLSLAIIALVMLALGAWRYLPRYLMEGRLLLNVGAARQGERVVYRGLPLRIARLNLHSELRNPELDGVIRLPLAALAQLISRPQVDEGWFPCRVGDYLLLPDGAFAQVLRQTIERVQLKVMGSTVEYDAAEFLGLGARNLSREGFGVAVTFGIDYQHQAIALEQVPQRFREGLVEAFAEADFGDDLADLLVEFKAAGTNSLDYLIYASMLGNSASYYFKIGRLIQQTCVAICNREGWVIPFTQVTIHSARDEAAEAAEPA